MKYLFSRTTSKLKNPLPTKATVPNHIVDDSQKLKEMKSIISGKLLCIYIRFPDFQAYTCINTVIFCSMHVVCVNLCQFD